MAAHSSAQEITDEDAAVLQFPKEMSPESCGSSLWPTRKSNSEVCFICLKPLSGIFIRCEECVRVDICPACFAKGKESKQHLNNHGYRVIRDDFPLFDGWTARQELNLLDQLSTHGPSNWIEVAKRFKATPEECAHHYNKWYLEDPVEALPRPKSPDRLYRPLPIVYRTGTHDPPRPVPGSVYHRDMAGYCAARGDFQVEPFQSAELDVASLQDETKPEADEEIEEEDLELERALTIAVVQVYNDKLRERFRKKRIIQEHGLINFHRHLAARYRYDSTLTHRVCERLSVFSQVLKFQDHCRLFEGLHGHAELRQRIQQLQRYRHLGIKTLAAAKIYKQLQVRREKQMKQWKQFAANLHAAFPVPHQHQQLVASALLQGSNGNALLASTGHFPQQRRSAPPLDIVGLPGYDKLNEGERQLCSVSRLVPESYLEFRNILIAECRNRKGIRLAQARTLIKIDVNKTRKIFDFLLEEKLIYLPA
ncbi:transcriptional adapter 2-alpha isoform X1 [Daphnia magna]|uniref:transcriptional adapter 2-alpha isoform X1 n=1 Tax=Daphnia magna TaxID=35525 RepID=UPI001E1BC111|nr:transcriptional adapter 2-alpha isoform X1 [Daphnia magna]